MWWPGQPNNKVQKDWIMLCLTIFLAFYLVQTDSFQPKCTKRIDSKLCMKKDDHDILIRAYRGTCFNHLSLIYYLLTHWLTHRLTNSLTCLLTNSLNLFNNSCSLVRSLAHLSIIGEAVDRTPVWLMRQAGRYMADFRKYSEKYPFRQRSETPEIAIELSLQPWRTFGVDGDFIHSCAY